MKKRSLFGPPNVPGSSGDGSDNRPPSGPLDARGGLDSALCNDRGEVDSYRQTFTNSMQGIGRADGSLGSSGYELESADDTDANDLELTGQVANVEEFGTVVGERDKLVTRAPDGDDGSAFGKAIG